MTAAEDVQDPEVTTRPWWHLALRIGGGLVIAVVVVAVLSDKVPSPAEIGRAFKSANWAWVVAAAALQAASIGMLVRQQRRLLNAFGIPVQLHRVAAITYSSTAITNSLPAGGAVGAGWSYKQYRANGASPATAGAVLLISGVLSVLALVLLYLAGLGLAAGSKFMHLGQQYPLYAALVGLIGLAVISGLGWLLRRGARAIPAEGANQARSQRFAAWQERHHRIGPAVKGLLTTGRRARRVDARDWRLALLTSVGNWALDAACLYASCLAVHIHISLVELGLIYLGVQLVRAIPLTPGGLGVVEASLLAALVAAGAAQGPGSAAVLIYRLFSAWLIVPIGYGMMWLLRRRPQTASAQAAGGPVAPPNGVDEPARIDTVAADDSALTESRARDERTEAGEVDRPGVRTGNPRDPRPQQMPEQGVGDDDHGSADP